MSTEEKLTVLLKQFLNAEGGNESQKLESLINTIENIEHAYKLRDMQRIKDLQTVLNNVHSSKGVLKYVRDYKRQLNNAIKETKKSIKQIDKETEELNTDNIVIQKRYNNFKNNVVGTADECQWEMDKIFKLLLDDNYDDDDDDDDDEYKDSDHFLKIKHTDLGKLGMELTQSKHRIDSRNKALDDISKTFQQIRYGHSMQYHHDRESYVYFRKNIDLQVDHEEALFKRQFSTTSSQASDDNVGLLLELDDDGLH